MWALVLALTLFLPPGVLAQEPLKAESWGTKNVTAGAFSVVVSFSSTHTTLVIQEKASSPVMYSFNILWLGYAPSVSGVDLEINHPPGSVPNKTTGKHNQPIENPFGGPPLTGYWALATSNLPGTTAFTVKFPKEAIDTLVAAGFDQFLVTIESKTPGNLGKFVFTLRGFTFATIQRPTEKPPKDPRVPETKADKLRM